MTDSNSPKPRSSSSFNEFLVSPNSAPRDLFISESSAPSATPPLQEFPVVGHSNNSAETLCNFLKGISIYEIMPVNGKVVTLDSRLTVKEAFFAMMDQCVANAALWDSSSRDYVGILSGADFIDMLRHFYIHSFDSISDDLESCELHAWRQQNKGSRRPSVALITISPEDNVYKAIQKMISNHIHRLAVRETLVDKVAKWNDMHIPQTSVVLYMVTMPRILRYLLPFLPDRVREEVAIPISATSIGTWHDIATVPQDCSLINVLNIVAQRNIAVVPVVNSEGVIVGGFSTRDVLRLPTQDRYDNLDIPISSVMLPAVSPHMVIFKRDASLLSLLLDLSRTGLYSSVCVDEQNKVLGVCTLGDIFRYFIGDGVDE